MTIHVECANCHAKFRVDSKYAGRTAKCGKCGVRLRIPALDGAAITADLAVASELPQASNSVSVPTRSCGRTEAHVRNWLLFTSIVGTQYPNPDGSSREECLANCVAGDRLLLNREPDNPHDQNAVAVWTQSGCQLGYLNRDLAAKLSPVLDHGGNAHAEVISDERESIIVRVFDPWTLQRHAIMEYDMDGNLLFPREVSFFAQAPKGHQIRKALAYGIPCPRTLTQGDLRLKIDHIKSRLSGPPTPGQIIVLRHFCVELPQSVKDGWDCREFIYTYMTARTWVYSVIRHVIKAKWRTYEECGLPEHAVAKIASSLMRNSDLFARVSQKELSEGAADADPWFRFSTRAAQSPEYAFVRDFELPDEDVGRINAL